MANRNYLFDLVPEAKAYYNFEKNKDIDASTLSVGSNKKVWWKCPHCGVETFQTVNSKVKKLSDGSYCLKRCSKHNDSRRGKAGMLETVSSTECLSRIWDPANSPDLDPDSLRINSKDRAHWVCPKCGHGWSAPVYRAYDASGRCPACECRNSIVPGYTDVMSLAPDAKRFYAWDKNADIDIEHLGVSSDTEVWWRCPECGCEKKIKIRNKIKIKDGKYYVHGCLRCMRKTRIEPAKDNVKPKYVSENENMMKFWDWDGNEGLDPTTLGVYSKKVVSWKCPKCGYTWRNKLINMRDTTKIKCPNCDKRHVAESENMMKFWSQDDNNGIDPATLSIHSPKVVTWRCPKCGHKWKSSVQAMRKSKGLCPCCDLHRVVVLGVNDVFSRFPETRDYYDFEKNADIDITKLNLSSKQKVWWKCPTCGNETHTPFAQKIRKVDGKYRFGTCRMCSRRNGNIQKKDDTKDYPDLGDHSLAAHFPDIAFQWSANNRRQATTVTPSSTIDALWVCPDCKNDYHALVRDMVNGNASCPFCSNKRTLPGYNTLADKNPDIAKLWSSNNDLRPINVFPTSSFAVFWSCPDCGGEYAAPVKDMVIGIAECPYCAGRRPLSGHNTLADKYPTLAAMWSADNDRGADSVLPDSPYEARWVCSGCGGKYDAPVRDMVNGTIECPYCADKKALPGFNSFAAKHPDLLKEWNYIHNYAIDIDPDAILDNNSNEAWWICGLGHKYKMPVSKRLMFEKRHKVACPICKGRRREVRHFI